MYMRLSQIALSLLLLIVGIADVFAQPYGIGHIAAFSFYAQDRGPQGNEQPRDSDRRRVRDFNSSGFSIGGDNASNHPPQDPSRRQGKLSPEERRALRRQIDEAGHDIYAPKKR